jgi:hypothetical protein
MEERLVVIKEPSQDGTALDPSQSGFANEMPLFHHSSIPTETTGTPLSSSPHGLAKDKIPATKAPESNQSNLSHLDPLAKEFQPTGQSSAQSPVTVGQVRFVDSSLFVTAMVGGLTIPVLLDTGAASTILSNSLWQKCPKSKTANLRPATGSLHSFSGEDLKIVGNADVEIQIGPLVVHHPVVIGEKVMDMCLLGSDFFANL